jgi:hypothetical protein
LVAPRRIAGSHLARPAWIAPDVCSVMFGRGSGSRSSVSFPPKPTEPIEKKGDKEIMLDVQISLRGVQIAQEIKRSLVVCADLKAKIGSHVFNNSECLCEFTCRRRIWCRSTWYFFYVTISSLVTSWEFCAKGKDTRLLGSGGRLSSFGSLACRKLFCFVLGDVLGLHPIFRLRRQTYTAYLDP